MTVHPVIYPQPNRGIEHFVTIRKKLIMRESTRKNPCGAYTKDACNDIENYKKIILRFQCQIPFLYFGHHLDNLYSKPLQDCNQTATRESVKFFDIKNEFCKGADACEKTRFSFTIQQFNNEDTEFKVENASFRSELKKSTVIKIGYQDIEVERHHTQISFSLYNLISEIGGTLGLTLGASALTLMDYLAQAIQRFFSLRM